MPTHSQEPSGFVEVCPQDCGQLLAEIGEVRRPTHLVTGVVAALENAVSCVPISSGLLHQQQGIEWSLGLQTCCYPTHQPRTERKAQSSVMPAALVVLEMDRKSKAVWDSEMATGMR